MHSRFVQRIRRRYAAELPLLPPGAPDFAAVMALVQRLQQGGRALPSALRVARQLCLERLACLDTEQAAPLQTITASMTALAEATLELALAQALADAEERHGAPLDAQGQRIEFWIVGMGKLGARELNVSSDIDLIYVYEDDGETSGPLRISAHEFFALVAKRLYALIGETTDDGFVFRVDLALRPNGNSGPPAVSLPMLEEYFQDQGREWERFAWLKSRVVAPAASVTSGRALALRSLVAPFVYRRYLDYSVFEGLRQLHRKIRDEAQRRAAGRPERANDVKLSRGGIREIEFIVQLMQVARGGQFPEIRTRSTLQKPAAPERARADEAGHRGSAGAGLCLPAPRRAPHPVPRRPADAPAAHGRRRPGLDRAQHGPVLRRRRLRAARPPGRGTRTGGHRIRRAAARRPGACAGLGRPQRLRHLRRRAAAGGQRSAARDACRRSSPNGCANGSPIRAWWRCATRASCGWGGWSSARPIVWPTSAAASLRRCASSTGSSRCCAARATSRCWSSGPPCSSGCCACWAWRAGRCST